MTDKRNGLTGQAEKQTSGMKNIMEDPEYQKALAEGMEELLGPGTVLIKESMALHTTFRAGGAAALYVSEVGDTEKLCHLLAFLKEREVPHTVIGKGSNLLVSDRGYQGVIVDLSGTLTDVRVDGGRILAQAGASLAATAREALSHSLTGMEFAAGIPGTVGGAVVMNAGAYGGEIRDILQSVMVFTEGEMKLLPAEELDLGYRRSIFTEHPGQMTVLAAEFLLQPGDSAEILAKMEDLAARRREKQPLNYPSAGSTFKRPKDDFAGKLIQEAGLSGYRVGGAMVSDRHCGFVINYDHATATEIYELCRRVSDRVYENSGKRLELEVRLLGEFD